jgi:cysteine desulfurase
LTSVLRPETRFVSIMHGNNEVGSLQDLMELGTLLKSKGIWFHTDAVQTVGKVPIDLNTLPVDALTLSAHKLYGPKGVGALYCRKETPLHSPLLLGGGQESGMRSGTENIAGIVGLATALSDCCDGMASEIRRLNALQAKLIEGIRSLISFSVFNGPQDLRHRVPGNVNFSFPPLQGESLVIKLDMKGFSVSSGSACHSAVIEPSHVLLAIGKSTDEAMSSLRFSMGRHTQPEHIEALLEVLPNIVARHKSNHGLGLSSSK